MALSQRFCYNGRGFVGSARELSCLPCSCINQLGMLHDLPKITNLTLSSTFGRRNELQLFQGHCRINLSTARHKPIERPHLFSLRPCLVKSEDSEGVLTDESIILDEKTLKSDLQAAIEEENYAKAAEIRDSLRNLQEDSKAAVLAANARFYNSFRIGDLAAMQALWAKGSNVCCVHPGAGAISSYDLVMESWDHVLAHAEFPLKIELKDVKVHVRGDIGYVTCLELVKTKGSSWGKQFATNVFERIDGQWFLCIHHASYVTM